MDGSSNTPCCESRIAAEAIDFLASHDVGHGDAVGTLRELGFDHAARALADRRQDRFAQIRPGSCAAPA